MKKIRFFVVMWLWVGIPFLHAETWQTNEFQLTVNNDGKVTGLYDKVHSTEYGLTESPSPLLQVRINGTFQTPRKMTWNTTSNQMTLHYDTVRAIIQVETKDSHINLTLTDLSPKDLVDRVQWGPIAVAMNQTVREVIGVVSNDIFSIGLQVLNTKTLGGQSPNEEGRDTSRGRTAEKTASGSSLQAYSIDRSRPRSISVWGEHYPNMPVPPIPGETCIGSKIALFGCPAHQTLQRIGQIELAEGLPHPIIDGNWSRMNPNLKRSYLIADFSEQNIDQMLDYAKRGNFLSLYHGGPFKSWGHYELNPRFFPNGKAGMIKCVEKAKALGIRIGVHTLTNFINTNDPYITPIPDSRLAKTGSGFLVSDIDNTQTEIEVKSPEYFNNNKANWLHTVMIGSELIRYGSVTGQSPWILQNCQRGAFGTTASQHKKDTEVAKLMDHPYKVFFPNYEMQSEIAIRLAELFNETGIGHFDFDGHEGCWASGQGDFGIEQFAKVFYDHLKEPVLNGTSNSQPFYWHINTCCNWGEPWYGGFRSSMADYRINNQAMLERNFMPKMLGWFLITPDTTLADIEWLMARSASYDSGFAIATSQQSLQKNPLTNNLLDSISQWESLRLNGAFSDDQKKQMQNTDNEFHLEKIADGNYLLYSYHNSKQYSYEHTVRQPGEPTDAQWEYTSSGRKQPLQFILKADGQSGSLDNAIIEFDNYITFQIPLPVQHGQTLLCDGTNILRLFDEKGRQIKIIQINTPLPEIPPGTHAVSFSCDFTGEPAPKAQMQFKSRDQGQTIHMLKH